MKPKWHYSVFLAYNYGGDTGQCTVINESVGPVDYDELVKAIDRLGEEIRQLVKDNS